MDSLKQNAFGLALGGVALVLLVLAYLLLYQPLDALKKQETSLRAKDKRLRDFLAADPLPTEDYVERVTKAQDEARRQYDDALAVYSRRAARFKLFFGDAEAVPAASDFSAQYKDAVANPQTGLRAKYWAAFPKPVTPGEAELDPTKRTPVVDMVSDAELAEGELKIRQAMQRYWIMEAVFNACHKLELGGLEKISFQAGPPRGRSEPKRAAEPKPGTHPKYGLVHSQVIIRLPYSRLAAFIEELYRSDRVPFLEPKKVAMQKPRDVLEGFTSYSRVRQYPTEGLARADERKGEPRVEEPPVEVTLDLAALDWQGIQVTPTQGS